MSKTSAGPSKSGASRIEPHALMRIRNLQLRAKVVVEGFQSGLHRSPYHGFSVEFSEYRQYSPGDDPRYLDWRVYARTDRSFVKRFEDETSLRCHLLVDLSRSMGFASETYSKADYARTVAATLAYFLSLQRDAVGLLTFDEQVGEYMAPRYRPGHLHRLLLRLERSVAGTATRMDVALEQIARVVSKRGLIVLISDLLAPIETLQKHLVYLRARGHEVILFRVLDRAEKEFSFGGPAVFQDLESRREMYVDPATARAQYRRRFGVHSDAIGQLCNELGIDLFEMTTDRPLEYALFDFLSARRRRGRAPAGTVSFSTQASR